MKSILITGCNRGLGLGLIKCLVKDINSPKNIIATCRNKSKAQVQYLGLKVPPVLGFDLNHQKILPYLKELNDIATQNKNVHILELDVTNTNTFDSFACEIEKIVADNGLNVLFNNAGYSPKSTRINAVKAEQMMETYAVNVVGTLMLTKVLLPLLKRAADVNQNETFGSSRSAVINMSSVLGSIGLNDIGGLYPYRCSKAAVNMATKSLSIDLKKDGILVTCIHPGWVKTDMGGSNATMDVETSAIGMIQIIRNLSETHNGGFYQWDGKQLKW